MAKEKQVQMPERWFMAVYRYMHGAEDERDTILKGFEEKARRIEMRALQNIMHDKTKTETERENARTKYLDLREIPDEFRW